MRYSAGMEPAEGHQPQCHSQTGHGDNRLSKFLSHPMEVGLGLILHLLIHQETTSRCLVRGGAVWGPTGAPPAPKVLPKQALSLTPAQTVLL